MNGSIGLLNPLTSTVKQPRSKHPDQTDSSRVDWDNETTKH